MGDNGLLNGEHGMVDKRTMHEASIRIPLAIRYPGLTRDTTGIGKIVTQQVLTEDIPPSILEICQRAIIGRDPRQIVRQTRSARRQLLAQVMVLRVHYEKQFPYTPMSAVSERTSGKYIPLSARRRRP